MTIKYNGKHLTTTQRMYIEKGLIDGKNFSEIARQIEKHPSTIAREIKKHRYFPTRNRPEDRIACSRKDICQIRFLCEATDCLKLCKRCYRPTIDKDCRTKCPEYRPKVCDKVSKAPYVCNGCSKFKKCNLQHALYSAKSADESYSALLKSSRIGINQEAADIAMLDQLISPLLKNNQSMAHIYANHGHEIPCSRRTLYNYIDKGVFEAKNIDLRRKVRYKCKPRRKGTRVSLLARKFRIGRTYDEFTKFLDKHPHTNVVEMDTVVGGKNNSSKVLLTMLFRNCSLMLIFLLDSNSQANVTEVFNLLTDRLGTKTFNRLFPVILTDNGTEFQDPEALEFDKDGNQRTKIYYCNPNSSWQKGSIEKNHTYIRYVIPKGQSMDFLDHERVNRLMNHINSEARDSLNGCTPHKLSQLLLNNDLHKLVKLREIEPDKVYLKPALLK